MRGLDLTAAALIGAAATAPALAETVSVDGHDVYYEVHGDLASGRMPVLMLHGGAMNITSSFGKVIPQIAATRPVIGVEQQGHGHTPLNDNPITLDSMRADTIGVLDALNVGRAHVIGFSAGGMLAMDLAVNAPDRVASLTAISASQNGAGMLPDLMRMQKEPGFTPPPDIAALMPSEADFAAMAKDIAEMNPGGAATVEKTMAKMSAFITSDWGWTDAQLAGIRAPTLIVIGDTDFILPSHALHLKETIPGAWLAILPDTTHLNILDRAELWSMAERRIDTADAQ